MFSSRQSPIATALVDANRTPIAPQQNGQRQSTHKSTITSNLVAPEDFKLPSGQLSIINHSAPTTPADLFKCVGCTDPICLASPTGCAGITWRSQPGGYLKEILTAKVYDVAVETPLQKATKLSETLESTILLKREDLQPVKSFKLRGAYNKMAQLSPEQLEKGCICSSAGNHAQGVALSAARLGCNAVIVMPVTTPDIKVAAVRALGGTVELVGESYQEAQEHAMARSRAEGRVFVAPYDDPYTIAGQGTIAAEILRQTDMDKLDAIFVAIGGGGLVAGIAAYIKALKPGIKVIGVEPVGANAMAQSLVLGERVTLSKVDTFADGVAVKHVGAETFRLCKELLDGIVLVDNSAVSAAIKDVFNETRSILEPAGAVAVAGAKAYLKNYNLKGQTVVAVTSGANMNFDQLRLVAELAGVGAAEAMLSVVIPERPGTFLKLTEIASGFDNNDSHDSSSGNGASHSNNNYNAAGQIDVTEFKYRYSENPNGQAHILLGVGLPPNSPQSAALVERLIAAGLPAEDISDIELAQLHLRHLVGGRARGGDEQGLPNERIFQVDFPERVGALRTFLKALSPNWNISLFHYRRTGNRSSGVLLGLQVPEEDDEKFWEMVKGLNGEFTILELSGRAKDVFKMFIR